MINIDILYVDGCSSTPQTVKLIEEVLSEVGVDAKINLKLISNSEEAKEYKLFGSPTVQINGLDIDPKVRDQNWSGIT